MRRGIVVGLGLAGVTVLLASLQSAARAQGDAWGNVQGQITWGGKDIPKQDPIAAVNASPDKAACMKGGNVVIDETWVVNPKNKGLQWTFVWLAPMKKGDAIPIHPNLQKPKANKVVMDQPLCAFIPHALALRQGQDLIANNTSGIAHNFKWTGNPSTPNAGNNILIPAGGQFAIKGLVADRLPVKIECNIHPWMNGWVRIFDHPYYAVTDADGKFEFKDAPAGEYRLMVWAGSGGWLGGAKGRDGQRITIKGGDTLKLGSLEYPPPQ
jgi:hypothetical protein